MGNRFNKPSDPPGPKSDKGHYKFTTILDSHRTIEDVQIALRVAGLESSNLIVGVDFTASNTFSGKHSFFGRCLHDTSGPVNPYQHVLGIVGRTLEAFDDDHLIPAYGFGDQETGGNSCFPFYPDRPCNGLKEVLDRYAEITPKIVLSGPTNFAPIIEKAIEIVSENKSYHILVIIADGQVTCETETIKALVRASSFPLSIIMIGVGDGPWGMMRQFDNRLDNECRRFDNFQFVCFSELQSALLNKKKLREQPETITEAQEDAFFALEMLMEIPEQYRAIKNLNLLL